MSVIVKWTIVMRKASKILAPYAGIISVGLGFVYWIFNDGVTKNMEAKHATLAQLGTDRWMYEALSRSLEESRNISKFLLRSQQAHDVGSSDQQINQAQIEFNYQADEIAMAEQLQSDIADLIQYGWRIQNLGQRLDISDATRKEIDQTVQRSLEWSNRVSQAGKARREKFNQVFHSHAASFKDVTMENVQALWPSVKAYGESARNGSYLDLVNALNDQSATLYANAEAEAKHAARVAAWTEPIGYIVYSIATAIALYGKWAELKSGRKVSDESVGTSHQTTE